RRTQVAAPDATVRRADANKGDLRRCNRARWAAHDGQASGSSVSHDAIRREKEREGERRERRRVDRLRSYRGNEKITTVI
ncbi:hypothetical protein ALC57_04318, partial [Trachymyrmex cornetzi]